MTGSLMSRDWNFAYSGALTFSVWSTLREARRVIFVVPVSNRSGASDWKCLGVQPIPDYTTKRLTIGMVGAVAAFHFGIVGIPQGASSHLPLPGYHLHWVKGLASQGTALTDEQAAQSISVGLEGRGIWIVPSCELPCSNEMAVDPFLLSSLVTKTLRKYTKEKADGHRDKKVGFAISNSNHFRKHILPQDDHKCVLTGEVESVQASHIIDRYIGSSIFGGVLEEIWRLAEMYDCCVPAILQTQLQSKDLLFADIRITPPPFYPGEFALVDQSFNGETLSPSLHVAKDIYTAHATYPPSGLILWFNIASSMNLCAFPVCGGLAQSTTVPLGHETILYARKAGEQNSDGPRFAPRCFRFYLTMCLKFMPNHTKSYIRQMVATASDGREQDKEEDRSLQMDLDRQDKPPSGDRQSDLANDRQLPGQYDSYGEHDHNISFFRIAGCFFVALLALIVEYFALTVEHLGLFFFEGRPSIGGGIPASTSNTSNLSAGTNLTLVNSHPNQDIIKDVCHWPVIDDIDEATSKEAKEAAKAQILSIFPHLKVQDSSLAELQNYHQTRVLEAALLIHLRAYLAGNSATPQLTPSIG
ncbi:hypothetical protein GGX14DRAFT_623759 [Mycena pura]|uniref:Uncharacterized protein n=1 Tax=Mycena pura TaxID=153505 RepID=A0AAD6YHY5_9AGAR|nr:hypothetical protein GGX14DRAFT_623759 [Mycena pura]